MGNAVMRIFNVNNWKYYELKTLLVFLILERFGDIMANAGSTHLNVLLSANGDLASFVALKTKLQSSYGEDLGFELMEGTKDSVIARIDLKSWQKCVAPDESEGESEDDDVIDRELYLE